MEEYLNRDGLGTRILVIGCPGSGKSTFARELKRSTGLPLIHLDQLFWKPDGTTVSKEVFLQRLRAAMDQPHWIIDGNYASTLELRIHACDSVFFLDYPTELCLAGVMARRGQARSDLPWVEKRDEAPDKELLDRIRNFPLEGRPQILSLMEQYSEKHWVVFRNRQEAEAFLLEQRQGRRPEE